MTILHGSLEHFALPDVFRLLAHNRASGGLKVVRESGDGLVYFRDGEVYFAFSSLTREFLGQRLVNAKLITQGQLLRVLDEQKRSGEGRLGELLVDKGYLSRDLLDTFLKEQIQDAVFHLLQWDAGNFEFDAELKSPQEVGLSVSVENLIMESSRRIEEWEVIQRKIPSVDAIVRMSPAPPEDAMEINIKPEEWKLLVLADGQRSVRDIAAASERSEFEAARILYGLVTAGLLDVSSTGVTPGVAPRGPATDRALAASPPTAEPAEAEGPPEEETPAVKEPEPEATVTTDAGSLDVPGTQEAEDVEVPQPIEEPEAPVEVQVVKNGPAPQSAPTADPEVGQEGGSRSDVSKELLMKLIAGVREL